MVDPSDNDFPRAGERIGERYEVLRLIGTGGMGVVLAARHLERGQEVAIKMLQRAAAQEGEAVGRFLREGKAASVLRSPHAVRFLDFGETQGAPFLVMELLRGQDLGAHLEQHGPMPLGEVARLLLQACHALEEAHSRGIVHRDLKPSNLFLVEEPGQPTLLKVLDFGISKFMGADEMQASLTGTKSTLGTPLYMSPEQVRNAKRVDTRTDLWSLGVLLQELLTGRPPFEATSFSGLCAAIIADPPRPIREDWPGVPPEIEALLARCLEKDPARRIASVREFAEVLAPHAGVAMAPAPRPSRASADPEEETLAASGDGLFPGAASSSELAPTDRAPSLLPNASITGNTRSLAGVTSSRAPAPPAPRGKYAAAALLLLPLGAFLLWPRTAPPSAPASSAAAVVASASVSAAGEGSSTSTSTSTSTAERAASAPAAASASASASAAGEKPAPRPAVRPAVTKAVTQGYSPANDDRK